MNLAFRKGGITMNSMKLMPSLTLANLISGFALLVLNKLPIPKLVMIVIILGIWLMVVLSTRGKLNEETTT